MTSGIPLRAPGTQNYKATLANAYNELGKELSSSKIRVIGNYTLGKVIGEGAYGKVRMGTHRLTSTRVAIKQIPKAMSASLTREIHHHRQLHHPNVTQMYEVIATESSIWIVTELCSGGELFDYLVEKGRISEEETKILFGQLCLAVAYLHERNIVHRDLKLENVLLDERCRVKLGDFGFTREFERGALMETFCGTTGYAAPEMLQGKKYNGPEVDVWSLGIILYVLLTGTLPFDDDDESVMRDKIIQAEFEDPEWLSIEARELIKNILQKDTSKRFTIPQILAHPWFTAPKRSESTPGFLPVPRNPSPSPSNAPMSPPASPKETRRFSEVSKLSDISFLSVSSDTFPTTTSPEKANFNDTPNNTNVLPAFNITAHGNQSQTTLKTSHSGASKGDGDEPKDGSTASQMPSSTPKAAPPVYPARTPARTKRRSVSSALSDHDTGSPGRDKSAERLPPQDFSSLLNTPAPIIFSTPLERELLNNLSMLGFDTAQTVHSVLSNACDAAGAMWWMLQRKAEKRAAEEGATSGGLKLHDAVRKQVEAERGRQKADTGSRNKRTVGVQTDYVREHRHSLSLVRSAPQLAFVPPTPIIAENGPTTPPIPHSRSHSNPLLSPSPPPAEPSVRSQPSTPAGSFKDHGYTKIRKPRAGSVSIMQRATTALEAAGLVRKKSTDAIRDSHEKDKDRDRDTHRDRDVQRDRDRERSRDFDRKNTSVEESRSSYGSSSSKLTKSPPLRAHKDYPAPSTPEGSQEIHHPQPLTASPWVVTGSRNSPPLNNVPPQSPSPAGDSVSALPTFADSSGRKAPGQHRSRASLLTAFRLWFNEDRKGKRKEAAATVQRSQTVSGNPMGTVKRRLSGSGNNPIPSARKTRKRAHRHSISSRRSSSVNSRRSSGASAQPLVLESPHPIYEEGPPSRRSFGSHTPGSDRDPSSRPSSIRSFSGQHNHRKTSSANSVSSMHIRTASPLHKYHRRAGSTTSTKVIRQMPPTARPAHIRSSSTTSSVQSPPSSRPGSFYGENSDLEGPRNSSPFRRPTSGRSTNKDETPRRLSGSSSQFVAHKRQSPFLSPAGYMYSGSVGRSSWKKSWGVEPPGWQSRTTHLPIEILTISPPDGATGIRDVFSGRTSINLGEESDWVDEDDDVPAFAGGLGQNPIAASTGASEQTSASVQDPPVLLSAPPKGGNYAGRKNKRANRTSVPASGNAGANANGSTAARRPKAGAHSPAGRVSPVPGESKLESVAERAGGRRQLPTGRSGPAFRGHAIQEEDEEEEE